MTTRIGIIGAGPMATHHGKYFATCGRAQVIAVADPDQSRAQALASVCKAKAVADYRSFLGDVDAVVLASPNFLHREQAIAIAEAGKHLYCEKPVGLSGADARAMAEAVRKAGVVSQVGFATRFDPATHEMLRVFQAGELGELISITSRRLAWMDPAPGGWRADHAKSGGLLLEVNIHEIEWMLNAGPIEQVYARVRAAKPTSPLSNDHIWVTLRFANGGVGTHEGSWLSPTAMYYRSIQGTEGGMTTNEWSNELYRARRNENRTPVTLGSGYDQRANFLDAIAGTAAPAADIAWGAQVMAVVDAILESGRTGQPVAVTTTSPHAAAQAARAR